jgi:hypothetical protein
MREEFLGNPLPTLVTLTGESPALKALQAKLKSMMQNRAMPPQLIQPVQPVQTPQSIQVVPSPFSIPESTSTFVEPSPIEDFVEPEPEMFGGEVLNTILMIAAGAGLLYIAAKNKLIRL